MKDHFVRTRMQNGGKRMPMGLGFALTVTFLLPSANAQEVNLGTANNFAVLAGAAVANTGSTVINGGNVGVSAGSSVSGFPPGIINAPYTIHNNDSVAIDAQNALTTAYTTALGLPASESLTGQNLGGLTLTPGVYSFSSSAQLTGTLTLNDLGNPDAVFVFQIGTSLTTASDSSVVTINGPPIPGISVFWQIGTSATLGTGTDFEGNILADASITANTGTTVDGRLLARSGMVTLDDTTITVPPAEVVGGGGGGGGVPDTGSTLLLLGSALAALLACGRSRSCALPSQNA
jgi:hypothetical protein